MESEQRSELVRLTHDELLLVFNFRRVNDLRQDCLLCFSDELVKLERQDRAAPHNNVVQIDRRK